jgi:hypothetical protein
VFQRISEAKQHYEFEDHLHDCTPYD